MAKHLTPSFKTEQVAAGRVEVLGRDLAGRFLIRSVDGSPIDIKSLDFVKIVTDAEKQ